MERVRSGQEACLPFERELLELEDKIAATKSKSERERLSSELEKARTELFANLTPWQRVLMARHATRPRMMDYVPRIFDDLVELHGDRCSGDDPAMVGGIGRFQDRTVMVIGQEKGFTTEERVQRNFGMAHPEGYRKALRLFQMAERFKMPVISFVDTPAAHPGIEAEAGGQGSAIAQNLLALCGLRTPVFVTVIGEGGSGGALGIAVGDWVTMLEHAIYVICPPERCAEILWRDVEKKELAASAMRVTADELYKLGIIDAILPEPPGGAHRDPNQAAETLRDEIARFLQGCDEGKWTLEKRQAKFKRMGVWREIR